MKIKFYFGEILEQKNAKYFVCCVLIELLHCHYHLITIRVLPFLAFYVFNFYRWMASNIITCVHLGITFIYVIIVKNV